MKIYEFDLEDGGQHRVLYRTTEDEAIQLRRDLDRGGAKYTYITRGSLYETIEFMQEWSDDNVSDGEMLDLVMNTIKILNI